MGGMSSGKFCVICGAEEDDDKEGGWGPSFSKEVKLAKFCGELELSSLGLSGEGDGEEAFTAFYFLRQLERCSEFVKICGECSVVIGETVDKRMELEEVECEVLEMQIKLLVKLKEMEGVSKLYLREMGKVRERVKGSQLNGLEERRNVFGKGKGKCDLLGFRERILNMVTSLGTFGDKLDAKLCCDRDRDREQMTVPEEAQEMDSLLPSPPEWIPSIDDSSNDFDNISLSPPPPPLSLPDVDNVTEEEQTVKKIKLETDYPDENEVEQDNQQGEELKLTLTEDKADNDKHKAKPTIDRRKQARLNRRKLSQVDFSGMGPLKTKLIKSILLPRAYRSNSNPDDDDDDLLQKYKWSYLPPPTDQVQFGGYPIQITESEDNMTFSCLSCPTATYKFISKFPPTLSASALSERIYRGILSLKTNISDHLLSTHLNAFNCTICPAGQFKTLGITSYRRFTIHMNHHGRGGGKVSNVCEICGKMFPRGRDLRKHLDAHRIQSAPTEEEANELKKHQCAICGKKFYLLTNLKNHEEQHKPKELRSKVKCPFCGKEVFKQCYGTHKIYYCAKLVKTEERMKCEICGRSYKNGKSLGDHLMRKHKLKERPKLMGNRF